jgi:tetratricopeptide (TPR) repeat protein
VLLVVLLFTFGISTTLRTITWQSDLTLVQDALKKYPDSGHLNDAYARVLGAAGRQEEATAYWKKAIDLGRISYPAYSLGNIEKEKKNYAAAEKYYLQALWPKNKFEKKGSRPVAEMKLLHKRNPDIYLALVDLHWRMARQEPERLDYHHERILHFHQAACKVEPENAFLRYLLAKAYLRLGNLEEASKHFAAVKDMAPDTYYGTAAGKLMKVKEHRSNRRANRTFSSMILKK